MTISTSVDDLKTKNKVLFFIKIKYQKFIMFAPFKSMLVKDLVLYAIGGFA